MIPPIPARAIAAIDAPGDSVPIDGIVPIEEMVKHFAVQQFVQALMGGEPELTGIPDLTAQDG